jgi:Lar family restriction alleviation protein
MKELKTCPFCGSNDVRLSEAILRMKPAWMVECFKCYASVAAKYTKEKAIQVWNRRAPK